MKLKNILKTGLKVALPVVMGFYGLKGFSQNDFLRQKKAGILLIDMQDVYLKDIDKEELKEEIPNQIEVLKYAQRNNIPIYVLEMKDQGETTDTLKKVLSESPYQKIIKSSNGGFGRTNLDSLLQNKGVEELVFMGVNASACVFLTALGARDKGYKILTSSKIISDPKGEKYNELLTWYKHNGNLFEGPSELINYLGGSNEK